MIIANQIPTTGRKPLFLVRQLGFTSVEKFAESLPDKALVADVGAGLSTLGHEVASLRSDIHWVDIDPCYADKKVVNELEKDLPPNLELLAENIINSPTGLSKLNTKADIVFSYWLLPHLSLESDMPAKTALQNMHNLLKPDGKLVVGPVRDAGILKLFRYKGVVTYDKEDSKDKAIVDIIAKTKLWWLPRNVQGFSNRHNIHIGLRFVGGK